MGGAAGSGRRRDPAAYRRPQGGGEGLRTVGREARMLGATVPGRRRGTVAYRRPQGGGEGLRNCRARGPDVGCDGAREEERHRRVSKAPGRRRGAPKLSGARPGCRVRRCQGGGEAPSRIEGPREEERGSETVGREARMLGRGGIREEERSRRSSKAPGRRRGAPNCRALGPLVFAAATSGGGVRSPPGSMRSGRRRRAPRGNCGQAS